MFWQKFTFPELYRIIDAFRVAGWSVLQVSPVENRQIATLVVSKNRDTTIVVDVRKSMDAQYTRSQASFVLNWRGRYERVETIADVEDIIEENNI